MTRILWLASWYPNTRDQFEGDFIQRHAQAVSEKVPIELIFITKDNSTDSKNLRIEMDRFEDFRNLTQKIVYYSTGNQKDSIIQRFQSFYRYFSSWRKEINALIIKKQLPDLIHVHVVFKAGIVALYLKWKYKIPFVISEHWSGYFKEPDYSLFKKSLIERMITKLILKKATYVLPVSHSLGEQINRHWAPVSYKQISNVVDTRFFNYEGNMSNQNFRFIHISTLNYPKNPEAIIRAFVALRKSGVNAELVLVGSLNYRLKKYIDGMVPFNSDIICTGQINYQEVAIEIKKSNALVMFSSFENQPCVILESLCCGVPVISTNVGGIPEVVNSENGILIENGHEDELLNSMKEMINNYNRFNKSEISRKAVLRFSYENVAAQIVDVYNQILQ